MKICDDCGGCALPEIAGPAAEQPLSVELTITDGVMCKSIHVHRAGSIIPQHAHSYEHATLLAAGGIKVWRDGVYDGEYIAPSVLSIPAGVKHLFETTVDGSLLFCIHRIDRTGKIEIAAEHNILELH